MIGWVQNVLVELLEEVGGAELRDRVFALAGVPEGTRYRMDRNYSDEEVHRLLAATAEATGMDADELNEAYGRAFLAKSKRMFPKFFDDIRSSRDLLHRQASIHRSLGAGLRDAAERETVAKKFIVNEDGNDLVVDYQSQNGMCGLYRKMANIIADEHGERIVVTSERCAKRDGGPVQCRFRLHWPDADRG